MGGATKIPMQVLLEQDTIPNDEENFVAGYSRFLMVDQN